jgi:DNA-binding transcriptional MerR regulator
VAATKMYSALHTTGQLRATRAPRSGVEQSRQTPPGSTDPVPAAIAVRTPAAALVDPAVDLRVPDKRYFRIGEVAHIVAVEAHVLRYWEREFRSVRPAKSARGQRVYTRLDVLKLLRIRDLLYRDGFTIAGARKRLALGHVDDDGASPPAANAAREADAMSALEIAAQVAAPVANTATSEHRAPALPFIDLPHAASAPDRVAICAGATTAAVHGASLDVVQHRTLGAETLDQLRTLRAELEAFLAELTPDPTHVDRRAR